VVGRSSPVAVGQDFGRVDMMNGSEVTI
jgi:hypothetical protein